MKITATLIAMLVSPLLVPLPATAASTPIKVVASFTILKDLVENVGGANVSVTSIVGPNGDSHAYEPSPTDAASVSGADIFVINGLGFEGWMSRLVDASAFTGRLLTLSDGIVPRASESGAIDPHAWHDLKNVKIYVEEISAALCASDPDDCATYTANAAHYVAELDALDARTRAEIVAIPAAKRTIITSHDAFGYFGAAYGVKLLSAVGLSTDADPSARQIAELVTQIKTTGISALFVENMSDPRLITQIAAETGATVGGALFTDSLTNPGEGGATFLEMFTHNTALLIAAMSGQ